MELYKNENWLRYQYTELEKLQSEIAEECRVSQKTISKWMNKLGIKSRGYGGNRWKGGKRIDYRGYCYIYKPEHPFNKGNGYIKRARIRMEERLGRYLIPEEIVHHRDLDKLNDNIENLQIMTNSEHVKLHQKIRDILLDLSIF